MHNCRLELTWRTRDWFCLCLPVTVEMCAQGRIDIVRLETCRYRDFEAPRRPLHKLSTSAVTESWGRGGVKKYVQVSVLDMS